MSIQTYKHTFKDGSTITLRVDFSREDLRMDSTGYKGDNDDEYKIWRETVVFPDVYNRATAKQLMFAVKNGMRQFN